MRLHALTFAVIAAAIICYVVGWKNSSAALIAAGGAFELISWKRLLKGTKLASIKKTSA